MIESKSYLIHLFITSTFSYKLTLIIIGYIFTPINTNVPKSPETTHACGEVHSPPSHFQTISQGTLHYKFYPHRHRISYLQKIQGRLHGWNCRSNFVFGGDCARREHLEPHSDPRGGDFGRVKLLFCRAHPVHSARV